MSDERPPFPLVVGFPRSGTTLVRTLLDSHPDLAIPGESDLTVELAKADRGHGIERERVRALLDRSASLRAWGVDAEAVLGAVEGSSPPATAIVRAVYDTYASAMGCARAGDKTPFHANHLDLLGRVLPEAYVLHVVRDGRDSYAALRDVSWRRGDVVQLADRWRSLVARARETGTCLGEGRYREVRYEDLVRDPTGHAEAWCRWLGLRWDDEVVAAVADRRASAQRAQRYSDHGHDHARLDSPVVGAARDWRGELRRWEVVAFESAAADELAAHGYPVAVRPGGPAWRVRRAVAAAWVAGRRRVDPRWERVRGRSRAPQNEVI